MGIRLCCVIMYSTVAKVYGLTRPVETNDTLEGRAHYNRVELTRPCAAGH
jgi:hypothetical protein